MRPVLKKNGRRTRCLILMSIAILATGCAQSGTGVDENTSDRPYDTQAPAPNAEGTDTADKTPAAPESSGLPSESGTPDLQPSIPPGWNENNEVYGEYDGRIYLGKAFQGCGISYGLTRLYSADWNTGEGEIICTDPTCKHAGYDPEKNPDPTCTAIMSTEMSLFVPSIVYEGKRIIFETYSTAHDTENGMEARYDTDVLISEEDGSNRQKVTTIPGGVYFATGAIHNNKLYYSSFNGTIWKNDGEFVSEDGIPGVKQVQTEDYSLNCLDLRSFLVKEYLHSDQCFTDFCFTDDYMYCVSFDSSAAPCVLQLCPDTGECEKVYEGSDLVQLGGCIDGRPVLVLKEDKNAYSLAFPAADGVAGFAKCSRAIVVSWDDKVATCTGWGETTGADGNVYYSEYTVYDSAGNQIDKFGFDKYVNILFAVDDKLIYDVTAPDDGTSGTYFINTYDFGRCTTDGKQLILAE